MSRSWMFASLVILSLAAPAAGQDSHADFRRDHRDRLAPEPSMSVVSATPEMWFYQQECIRHDDPKMAIRHRAELKAAQRHERLASQKWYGISVSRPTCSPTPWFGGYSDHWASNTIDPLRWRPPVAPLVVLRPTSGATY